MKVTTRIESVVTLRIVAMKITKSQHRIKQSLAWFLAQCYVLLN